MKFYVYVYLDPRVVSEVAVLDTLLAYQPIYVGKGSGNRYTHHLRCKDRSNHTKNRYIAEMLQSGVTPEILILHRTADEAEAYAKESEVIAAIGTRYDNSGPLLNLLPCSAPGFSGEKHPFYGQHHTPEAKAKISLATQGENNPYFGRNHSEETKAKMRGRKVSEANKQQLRQLYAGGIVKTEEGRRRQKENTQRGAEHHGFGKTRPVEVVSAVCLKKVKYRYEILKDDQRLVTFSLKTFCRVHDLDERALNRSHAGKYAHKGYRMLSKETLPSSWADSPALLQEFHETTLQYQLPS